MVDLLVGVDGAQEVLLGLDLGLDQVVAMGGRRDLDLAQPCGVELQPCHLGCGVLHGHAVRTEVDVALPTLDFGVGIVEVVGEDLLGQGERTAQA